MRIIEHVGEMQQQANVWRQEGKIIGLVPTMGYLHEGHLALVKAARSHADVVVVSIFVNPTQFGPGEDFTRYPRNMERDLQLLREAGADAVFLPTAAEIYPHGHETHVEVTRVTLPLCGKSRPSHFRGVTTVVTKLFNIVKPHAAVFGEKDFQQLVTIRRMVQDLNMDVEIVGHPIVREADGLAMSSRNVYLDETQRQTALRLQKSLAAAQALVDTGEKRAEVVLKRVKEVLNGGDDLRIDYAQLRHPQTLEETVLLEGPTLCALATFVGKTRLIDNRVLNVLAKPDVRCLAAS